MQRNAEVLAGGERTGAGMGGAGGRRFYDFDVRVTSVADTNPLAAEPSLRVPEVEWTRRVIETMGCANGQLYELRLQTDEKDLDDAMDLFVKVATSLVLIEKDAPVTGLPPPLAF